MFLSVLPFLEIFPLHLRLGIRVNKSIIQWPKNQFKYKLGEC